MGGEGVDVAQRRLEIAAETHGTVVNEDVRRRLSVRNVCHEVFEVPLFEPAPHIVCIPGRKHDNAVAAADEGKKKLPCAGTGRIEMIGAAPPLIRVEHAVEIDARDRTIGLSAVHRAHRDEARRQSGPATCPPSAR